MRRVFHSEAGVAAATDCTPPSVPAKSCSSSFGNVCRHLWPHKTAENLAATAGISVRSAYYEISGRQRPSAESQAAVVIEFYRRWNHAARGAKRARLRLTAGGP